jgi:hypothetical protein
MNRRQSLIDISVLSLYDKGHQNQNKKTTPSAPYIRERSSIMVFNHIMIQSIHLLIEDYTEQHNHEKR